MLANTGHGAFAIDVLLSPGLPSIRVRIHFCCVLAGIPKPQRRAYLTPDPAGPYRFDRDGQAIACRPEEFHDD